jgi:hypothetical protein
MTFQNIPQTPKHGGVFDSQNWYLIITSAVNLTLLMYSFSVLNFLSLNKNYFDFILFVFIVIFSPIISSIIIFLLSKRDRVEHRFYDSALFSFLIIVSLAAITLSLLSLGVWLFGLSAFAWQVGARTVVTGLTVVHIALIATALLSPNSKLCQVLRGIHYISLRGRKFEAPLIVAILVLTAMFILYRVEPTKTASQVIFGLFANLTPTPDWLTLIIVIFMTILFIVACARLLRFEETVRITHPEKLQKIQNYTLFWIIIAIFYFYFDYTFNTDVLHYLTNIGPATQMMFADGFPMVSAFSQYGPGPLFMTWLGFQIGPLSFHTANVVTQLHSLTFYAVMIVCLYRMTTFRLAALLLGFAAIGVTLAGWGGGNHSLNVVPSAMGLRYLPCALVVLSISLLGDEKKYSNSTFAAMMISSLWSYETLMGSIAIYGLFLLLGAISNRSIIRGFFDFFIGMLLPIAGAFALQTVVTLVWVGEMPDVLTYLEFAKIYSFTSEFWSIASDGSFMGWIPVATVVMTAITLGWMSAFGHAKTNSLWGPSQLIYRIVPMAGLTAFMSSYYVGRSVSFTLIISFLPFSTLLIPPMLTLFRKAQSSDIVHRSLAAIPALAVFIALSFSFTVLYRDNSPYSTAVNQCLQYRNCTPIGLSQTLSQRFTLRPLLDRAANPNYYDATTLTSEAISLINTYEPERARIALFLGIHPTTIWSIHTNAVLFLVEKGHRWPISYVLSDELNPARRRQILAADIELEDGETVFVRKDETRLGELEAAILNKIRDEVNLCALPPFGELVVAYRVSTDKECTAS